MSIISKFKITKKVFQNNDFYIFGASPIQPYSENLKLNKYFSITLKGDLGFLEEGREYELEVEELSTDSYGTSYKVISVPSMESLDIEHLSREEALEIMEGITTKAQAKNCIDAYENFVYLAVNKEDEIDVKKIRNVGEFRLNAYVRDLKTKYKYLGTLNKFKEWKLEVSDCRKLLDNYKNNMTIEKEFKENPYKVNIDVLNRSFEYSDKLILELREDLKISEIRCAYLIQSVLDRNELDGDTKLNANCLYQYIMNQYTIANELEPLIVPVVKNNELFYYDEEEKTVAKMSTYLAECKVAEFIKDKVNNSTVLDIDYTKYKEIRDGVLTDEQQNILKTFCESNIVIVDSKGGCVDSETEFFNGKRWKKISEWTQDDRVLQYNQDGSAELVKPISYTVKTCDKFYHMSTKYGIDQMLSDEHRVIYKDKKGELKECNILDIKNLQETKGNGFEGRFITTFNYSGKGIDLTNEEIKVMCAVICDGSFNKSRPDSKYCHFRIKKDRKKIELRKIFKEANIKYKETESSEKGYTNFYIQAPRREKVFSDYWYNCSKEQLQVICDNILFWDGNINYTKKGKERKRFSTSIKDIADFVQFAFTACGYKASISINNRIGRIKTTNGKDYINKSLEYIVQITERNLVGLTHINDKGKTTTIEEINTPNGTKYCFTVPSHMLVLRRNNKIFITGNTGKSASTMALLDMLDDNDMTYTMVAPTGKVARIVKELTNRPACTIHKASLSNPDGIYSDVFILEEGSMVGLDLMCMFINLISNKNARIVVNMDLGQIAPISCGCPMRDIINSGIAPICKLTKVFRYGEGGLYKMATDAYDKKFYLPNNWETEDRISVGTNKDYTFVRYNGTVEQVIDEYKNFLAKGYKPCDISVITPWNVTDLGTININNRIQELINPVYNGDVYIEKTIRKQKVKFKVGDLILNTKNNYRVMNYEGYEAIKKDSYLTKDDVPCSMCMNGEIGKIVKIENGNIIAQFDEELLVFDKGMQNEILLAYSLTSYKLQGSSVPYVISLITPEFSKSLDKNIIYTDMSRTKKEIVEIIDPSTLANAISIDSIEERQTNLYKLLVSNCTE